MDSSHPLGGYRRSDRPIIRSFCCAGRLPEGVRRCGMKKISLMVLVLSSFVSSSDAAGGEPRENYSKVSISTRYLLAQPNASSPPQILSGLDSEIVEEYDESTLAYVSTDAI